MAKLTDEQKKQNRIQRVVDRFKGIGTGKRLAEVARKLQLVIRMEQADDDGFCKCVTCPTIKHYKEIHAGHCVSGRSQAVLFDERNIAPQCVRCNTFKAGEPAIFEQRIIDDQGQSVLDEIKQAKIIGKTYTVTMLAEMLIEYREREKIQKRRLG